MSTSRPTRHVVGSPSWYGEMNFKNDTDLHASRKRPSELSSSKGQAWPRSSVRCASSSMPSKTPTAMEKTSHACSHVAAASSFTFPVSSRRFSALTRDTASPAMSARVASRTRAWCGTGGPPDASPSRPSTTTSTVTPSGSDVAAAGAPRHDASGAATSRTAHRVSRPEGQTAEARTAVDGRASQPATLEGRGTYASSPDRPSSAASPTMRLIAASTVSASSLLPPRIVVSRRKAQEISSRPGTLAKSRSVKCTARTSRSDGVRATRIR
mmetsp:Transcript_3013/g.10276  ORF Transcript_3013/g.10276 Transcript_3013/m.10276 type:complete len:269 (-) Transcript_3013:1844-2650(-)